jgi:hypothetical protein
MERSDAGVGIRAFVLVEQCVELARRRSSVCSAGRDGVGGGVVVVCIDGDVYPLVLVEVTPGIFHTG